MKQEKLLQALGDVGDDLLHMASYRRFYNPWRRWVSLAACLALVISLGVLALPYLPMGCGASSKGEPSQTPMESAPNQWADTEETTTAEPPETVPEAETPESTEPEATESVPAPEVSATLWITYGSTYYYLEDTPTPGTPADLGEELGAVEDSNDDGFLNCTVYARAYCTWYANHAVDNLAVPNMIYVQRDGRYYYGMTHNEKTISRYSEAEIRQAVDQGNDDFLLTNFVFPLETYQVGSFPLDSQQMNQLFLASLRMNTGTFLDSPWMTDEGLQIPPADVRFRLERFLDQVDYDPTETLEYNPDTGLLHFSWETLYPETPALTLQEAQLENGTLYLETQNYRYILRLDADSWRYLDVSLR